MSVEIFTVVGKYIESAMDREKFQIISLDAYYANMIVCENHTHVAYRHKKTPDLDSDVVYYNFIEPVGENTVLSWDHNEAREMIEFGHDVIYYYMINDDVRYNELNSNYTYNFDEVVFFENPNKKITEITHESMIPLSTTIEPSVRIRFMNMSKCTKLCDSFCSGVNLDRIDFSGLFAVVEAGDDLMFTTYAEKMFDFGIFPSIKIIGNNFLVESEFTKGIDFRKMKRVVKLGDGMLDMAEYDLLLVDSTGCIGKRLLQPDYGGHTIKGFVITDPRNVTILVKESVRSVDLSPFTGIKHLKDKMFEYFGIIDLDVSPLSEVETIGKCFLARTARLQRLDMTPMSKIRSVGSWFLYKSSKLEELILPSFEHLTPPIIPDMFLSQCDSLRSVKFVGVQKIERIYSSFLFFANQLKYLDLSEMRELKFIGRESLVCSLLEKLKLPPNVKFETPDIVGTELLAEIEVYGCRKGIRSPTCDSFKDMYLDITFRSINEFQGLPPDVESVVVLTRRSHITKLDLEPLRGSFSLESGILCKFTNLTELDLEPLQNLKTAPMGFLSLCHSLKTANLSALVNLEYIGDDFMLGASMITTADFSRCKKLKYIGNSFMNCCGQLENLNISELYELIGIGNGFVNWCHNLSYVDLHKLYSLKTIGHDFLYDMPKVTLDMRNVFKLDSIGSWRMSKPKKTLTIKLNEHSTMKIAEWDMVSKILWE